MAASSKSTPEKKQVRLGVRPIEHERFAFEVDSEKGEAPYHVDLEALPVQSITVCGRVETVYNGSCTCPHFLMRLARKVEDGRVLRCKHIEAARSKLLDLILTDYMRKVLHVKPGTRY